MNYSEIILFISKSLTISYEKINLAEVRDLIISNKIDWDLFVKISTQQLVLSALYCNYEKSNLLQYLPVELISYMKYITDMNRDRNKKIISQANKLNSLLRINGVSPVFLKGTACLLQGIYIDIGERLIGDIDILVSDSQFDTAVKILKENKYKFVSSKDYHFPNFKHYPRLRSDFEISAIEIHKELIEEKFSNEFNYALVSNSILNIDDFSFLSYDYQKVLAILSAQINDYGFEYVKPNLRNTYDFFLLSKKFSTLNLNSNFKNLYKPINCFLITNYFLLGKLDSVKFNKTRYAERYLKKFISLLNSPLKRKYHNKFVRLKIILRIRFTIILKSFYRKDYRNWLIKRVSDKEWILRKFGNNNIN
tara:strand:- start:3756 stop:4850 length:1095 start_codon:yes stop_codon:yes gene_type:complete